MSHGTAVWLPDIKIVGIKENVARSDDENTQGEGSGAKNPPIIGATHRKADMRLVEDRFGEEMAPDATIWELYEEEANNFDDELVKGRSNNLDMMLLFAGLFSAVVTSFIVESKNMLQQDSGDASLALLLSIAQSQQRLAEGGTQLTSPIIEIPPFEVTRSARWINGLWFTSLALSLGAALIAMLAKEWLIAYVSSRPRSPYGRVVAHQRRLQGLGRWYALHIIDFLPSILHFALLLFSIGLMVYLWILDRAVAASIAVIAGLSVLFYTATAVLAAIHPFCPFVTQISKYIRGALISSRMLTPLNDTQLQSRSSVPISLEALQALKWLAENAQDQVTADCTYQALSGVRLSHNHDKLDGRVDERQQTRLDKPANLATESHYTLLAEMFEAICNRISLALVSGSGQLSVSQGISASRYACALPHLVRYLEATSAEITRDRKNKLRDHRQSPGDETPIYRALTALDFAWSDDGPHYTADAYALLTKAELDLVLIAASHPDLNPSALAPSSASPLQDTDGTKLDVSTQSEIVLDVKDVGAVAVKTFSLFDLRARFSRALFRAAIELMCYANKSVNIRDDALDNLLESIRLGFSCSALNPETSLSTNHLQGDAGLPTFYVNIVSTGSAWYLPPTDIDAPGGLLIGLIRTIDSQAISGTPELIRSAMHTFCVVAPVLLRQWLNENRNLDLGADVRARITELLLNFQKLCPIVPRLESGIDIAIALHTWTMKQLLFTALISGTASLVSGPQGVQQLPGKALRTLKTLTKGSIGQSCASGAASDSFGLVLMMVQRAYSKQRPLSETKDLVQWLLVKWDIDNRTVIQNVWSRGPVAGVDLYLELLEIWARVPELEPELEELVSKIVDGCIDEILVPLWSVSGLSKLDSIGGHRGYAPILSKLVTYMIDSSLGKGQTRCDLEDPSHRAALPYLVSLTGRALSVTPPSPERTRLSEAYIRSISAFSLLQQHFQANLVDEGLQSYENALEIIRQVSPSTLADSAPSDQFVADYEAIIRLADDLEAWIIGLLPWMLKKDGAPYEDEGCHGSSARQSRAANDPSGKLRGYPGC